MRPALPRPVALVALRLIAGCATTPEKPRDYQLMPIGVKTDAPTTSTPARRSPSV